MTVALLGDMELRVADRVVPITRPRLRALLCALALRANRVVPLDTLADEVWGEQVPDRPNAGLHTLVNQLRKLVGTDIVRTERSGYLLDVPPDSVDALRFERLLDSVPAAGTTDEARGLLVAALDLWRGDVVAGDLSGQVERDIAPHLVERYLSALERRVDIDLEQGRHGELVAELQRLTARHPLREPLWARRMIALYRSGRHAEALETYQAVRALLADTLGTNPSAELRALHALVLAADNDDAVVESPEPPEPPRQLPPDIAGFTGRTTDLAALDRALDTAFADDHTGRPPLIVAVHGPGGAGKTTLALHWAHRVGGRFPDGHVHVDMRGYGPGEPVDPATALDIVLRTVGIPPTQVPQSIAERTALWRTTLFGRRILLLIDNVRDAGQVRPLLPGAGSVVLVTSRNELRGLAVSDGARRLNLGELPVDDAIDLIGTVIGTDRCVEEPAALVELVGLCGRLPLALVIAAQQAARYLDTPLADLVAELRARSDRLDRLSDPGDPSVDPRAVFSWSYQALDADTARAFRYLGLHPTPEITLAAAGALLRASLPTARRLLDTLVSVHLLEQDQPGRYRFHDLLQVYAAELATKTDPTVDTQGCVRRILDWYLHSACNARDAAFTRFPLDIGTPVDDVVRPLEFPDTAAAMAWYNRHRATLLAVTEYAAEQGYDRHCWQMAFMLRYFQEIERHLDDGMRCAEVANRCAERSGDDQALIYGAFMMGAARNGTMRYEAATPWLKKSLALSERADDPVMAAASLVCIGLSFARAGHVADAIHWLERGVATARRASSTVPLAHALLNLGAVEGLHGLVHQSLAHSRQSLALYREMNSSYFEAFALGNMAEAALDTSEPEAALACAAEALDLLGAIEDQVTVPETLLVKGRILDQLGRPAAARETREQALRILSRNGHPRAGEVASLLADDDGATVHSGPTG